MNINWETIVDGFRGFEKLALEFVEENEPQNGCSWKPTKETRDGNHDAILAREVSDTPKPDFAVFVGYANNVDVWWMEAKYSAEATQEDIAWMQLLLAQFCHAIFQKSFLLQI